jgi:hypothetical protein
MNWGFYWNFYKKKLYLFKSIKDFANIWLKFEISCHLLNFKISRGNKNQINTSGGSRFIFFGWGTET